MGTDEKSGTETTDVQTGQDDAANSTDTKEQAPAEKPAETTETDSEKSGVLTEADLDEAAKAEEARKENIRKSKEGTDPGVQKKLDKENLRRKEAENTAAKAVAESIKLREETAFLKGKLEALQESGMSKKDAQKAVDQLKTDKPKMPRISDFDGTPKEYDEAMATYQDEYSAWLRADLRREQEEVESKRKGETEAQTAKRLQEEAQKQYNETLDGILENVAKEYGDDSVALILKKEFSLTTDMRDAVFSGEAPHKTLLFLAEHPDISHKIKQIPNPYDRGREISRLTAALTGKKQSSATAPISAVDGKGAGVNKPIEKMNAEELNALMYGG